MDIKLKDNGTEGELIISGKLDTNTAPEAQKLFLEMTNRFEKLIFDMGGLEYCSSAGLRSIMIVHSTMQEKGGTLILKNTIPAVMEVFEITGFSGVLNFE
ncbi:MAG: STAS domain-containing protein [Lachnospiraceae bacterium]|nr:STAS domain-containing protein [Lachnospiraceae bacterium]